MDNQKSNDGSARDQGREGAGSSMGKDLGANRTGGAGKELAKDMSQGVDASASQMHKTIDKAAEAAQPVVDRLASSAHAGVDKVSSALTGAGARVDDKTRQLGEAYKHFAETGRDYVRSSPATSVLIALAAGYTLSKLLGRRH